MTAISDYLDSRERLHQTAKMADAAPVFENSDYFDLPPHGKFLAGVEFTDEDGDRQFAELEHLSEAYHLQAVDALANTPKMTAAIETALSHHRKTPIYDVAAGDCEHGEDCEGVEVDVSETYCPDHIAYYTCECMLDDSSPDEFGEYPCDEVRAIFAALGLGE